VKSTNGTEVLSSAQMRWSKAILCAILASLLVLLLPQMARRTNGVVFVYMGFVCLGVVVLLVGVVRSLRAGIYLSEDRVVVRTTYSNRSWRWAELERAESIDLVSRGGPMGILAATSQRSEPRIQIIPVFRRVTGSPVVVRGLRVSITSVHDKNWLDDALHEVNRRIEAHRQSQAT
jgi:hypothetical protein